MPTMSFSRAETAEMSALPLPHRPTPDRNAAPRRAAAHPALNHPALDRRALARRALDRRRAARAWSLMAPLYGLILAVVVLPELWAFWLSFTDYSVGQTPHPVGLANYQTVLGAAEFWQAAARTLVFAAIAVTFEVAVGLGLACALEKDMRLRGLIIAILIAPIAMSQAVTSAIWSYLLDFNVGPLNWLTGILGLGRHQWLSTPETALIAVALVEFWAGMPHVLIMLYPVRAALPDELYEAAELDGADRRQLFRRITLPLMLPAVLIALIFRTIITLRAFGVIWILTKGGPLDASEILSIYMYKIGFHYFEFGHAAAIAWLVLLLTALVASFHIFRLYAVSFADQR
jgi:multiple sugar transport system permease protein